MSAAIKEAFFKVLVVGDGAVGKTSLCTQATTQEFFSDYNLTVGCDFFIKRLYVNDVSVTLQLFDIGGQDQFRKMRQAFSGGAKGIFLTYDITRRDSFYNLEQWYKSVKEDLDSRAPKFLISTKNDLKESAEIWKEDVTAFKDKISFEASFETSAYMGEGINEAFEAMGSMLLSRYDKDEYTKSAQKMKFLEGAYRGIRD